jgi:hypothetical protein
MPNPTLAFKGERCTGDEDSKEMITVVLRTNSTSTDELVAVVIEK